MKEENHVPLFFAGVLVCWGSKTIDPSTGAIPVNNKLHIKRRSGVFSKLNYCDSVTIQ
jgi:hypothetical protein